jgi:hypothetical protein
MRRRPSDLEAIPRAAVAQTLRAFGRLLIGRYLDRAATTGYFGRHLVTAFEDLTRITDTGRPHILVYK